MKKPPGREDRPAAAICLPLSAVAGTPFFKHDGGVTWLFRHLERRYVPLWETDRNRSHDALSREISHRNAARTIRGGEISPLRFASVEMTIGVSAATVISSGGFMRRLSRGVLFCPLNRGKSGEAGKGEASAASRSAECFSCYMTHKANPVTSLRPL